MPNGTSTPTLTPQQDMLLAQLADMGFSLEASRVAMAASGGTNLQEILDILVTDADLENQIPSNRSSQPPPLPRHNIPPPSSSAYQQPPPPPRTSSNYQQPPPSNYQPSSATTSDYNPPPPSTSSYTNQPPPSNPKASKSSDDDKDEDPRIEREKEEAFKRQQEERRKEYLDQLKREKPTPPTPSPRPPPKSPSPPIFTDPATLLYAEKERKQGNYLFNKSQFVEAEAAYTLAIEALPPGHGELVLLSNNRAAARLKQSKYQGCLTDCAMAIDVARKQMMTSNDPIWKQQMIKALHRKASALEGLCLFEAAIQVYEEYVRLDGTRSAQVSQGIMRCQQAMLDINKGKQKQPPQQPPRPTNPPTWKPANDSTAFPDIDFNMFIPANKQSQANLEEINKSKAVQEMRDREKKKEAEETEKLLKEDQVNAQISVWKTGKDKNLRALLGSLELILWPGVQWKGVQMSELLDPKKCKITYMKAIAKVHPDKVKKKDKIKI
jgi:tetratricopeptide (TPR) repeat protein